MASYIVTDRIRVNIVHSFAVPPRVKCEQYDGDYTKLIQAIVYNGDVLYSIPSAVRRIVVSGLKPDNTGFSYDCTWSGNTVSFSLMRQMTAVDGKVPCNITMFDASNNQVSSAVFVLDVEKAALPSDVVVSSNDFQTFIDYVQAAHLYSQYSKSYAVGNTGVREGENVDNAKYYAHLARMYKGSPLTASTISEMVDTERTYVYVGNESGYNNGHWYFYNDTEWVDGGVYNSEGIQTDTELIAEGVAADAKAVGDILGHESLTTTAKTLRGAINELNMLAVFVTPEMFGAIGNGVTDDTQALQTAINYAKTNGYTLILNATTYKITDTLDIPSGSRIKGATVPHQYVGGFKFTAIEANLSDNKPILSISPEEHNQYLGSTDAVKDEVYISNITLLGNNTTFCGIKCQLSNSRLEDISIIDCRIGLHCGHTYTTYIDHVNCLHCQIGFYFRLLTANAIIRNCWINYGTGILSNDNLNTAITTLLASQLDSLTKITGIFVLTGSATLENCCLENLYYGVFLNRGSSCYANNLSSELIVTGGAVFKDYSNISPNYVKGRNLRFYNSNAYNGKIAEPSYRSKYYLEVFGNKPTNFAESSTPTRGVLKLKFRDTEQYLEISSITGVTNPTITNNYTRFDKNGNIIVDFVLSNYESQNPSVAPILNFGNLNNSGFSDLTGLTPIIGTNLRYMHQYRSITALDGSYVALPKNTRYTFIAKYSPT